jgi:hypothetical protein
MAIQQHWSLSQDPFADGAGPFVPIPGHVEAVARLLDRIESGARLGSLFAAPGLGKSGILGEVLHRARHPRRRITRCGGALDGGTLYAELARGLGRRVWEPCNRHASWKALTDAVRLAPAQGLALVLAIDDVHLLLANPADRLDVERLAHLGASTGARVTVLRAGLPTDDPALPDGWDLAVRLAPLSRRETELYLTAKLAAAGRHEPTFTPRAVTRLHALALGVPRGLDHLARLALMAGALRGAEVVTPELVEGVLPECVAALR